MRLDTRAFAVAGGTVASASVFLLTLLFLVGPGDPEALSRLSGVLFGYSVSVAGAFVGGMWGYVYGFFLAGGVAFVYNVALFPPPAVEVEADLEAAAADGRQRDGE